MHHSHLKTKTGPLKIPNLKMHFSIMKRQAGCAVIYESTVQKLELGPISFHPKKTIKPQHHSAL